MKAKLEKRLDELLENTLDLALKRRAKWLIESLEPKDGDRILDVGCGDGYYLYLLSNLGLKLKLTGVDLDKRALKSAKSNLRGKEVKLIQGDLMKRLPFKSGSFDKIVMSEVLEHLPDDKKGLKEVKRVLKKGGSLVISVPNANYPFLWDPINWILENFLGTHIKSGFFAGIWNQHERLYSDKRLANVIEKSSLVVKKVDALTTWCLPFNHYIINLGARILVSRNISQLTKGSVKFNTDKRSLIPKVYFVISSFIDKMNIIIPKKSGVSLVLYAGEN